MNRKGFTPLEIRKYDGKIAKGDVTMYRKKQFEKIQFRKRKFLTGFTPLENFSLSRFIENAFQNRKRSLTGFTLIELMLVIIIIGALSAMVIPRLAGRSEQARVATARADVSANIATGLKLYELDNGNFPTTQEGLKALLNKPSSAINWNGPYLERPPIDPWGREYKYRSPGTNRPQSYDLYSVGKDGQEGTEDDVNNWE